MLFISHRLKPWWLLVVVTLVLVGCSTTTTLVEPEEPERLSPELDVFAPREPEFVPYPAATEGPFTPRKNKHTSSAQFRQARQAEPLAERPKAQPIIENKEPAPALIDEPKDQTNSVVETDPLTEQYRIDAPEFDPALGEESSESSASSEESETSDISESAETETANEARQHAPASESSASRASNPSSDRAESVASSSESAQQREPEPETAGPQSASADKKETGSSGSKELSDEALANEQFAGGGAPSSELPTPAEASQAEQQKDVPTASATGAEPESEPPKQDASAGAETEKPASAAGGLNVQTDEPLVSDKTDHSKHDHRYMADQHVEGVEEEPTKKSKTLHWNMQRQVKKVVE